MEKVERQLDGEDDMREQFFDFIQSPNRDSYLAIRELVISSDQYNPYSREMDAAGELYEQEKLEEAAETIQQALGNLMLSP